LVNLSIPSGVATLPGGTNLQFSDITISGTLIVPSGTILRATGNVTITGTITVLTAARDLLGNPHPGVSRAAPGAVGSDVVTSNGGLGLALLQAASQRVTPVGGGAGARGTSPAAGGGAGGGAFAIYAAGSITISAAGSILAIGADSLNPRTPGLSIVGTGGGGGGLIRLAAKGSLTVGGLIDVSGGHAAHGFDGNGGSGEGGGGGGGGGIVHLLAPAPNVSGRILVLGGYPGTNSPTSSTTMGSGGGGGASGGNGGSGGGGAGGPLTAPTAGAAGLDIRTATATPENIVP
jgi:hypothetical protein